MLLEILDQKMDLHNYDTILSKFIKNLMLFDNLIFILMI